MPLNSKSRITTIARYLEDHIDQHWQGVFDAMAQEMADLYPKLGDMVYGRYISRLLRPALAHMKAAGLRSSPRLPGSLMQSREWGASETDRQRWMWSKISGDGGAAIGTIAFGFHHDHMQIRLPRPPQIVPLDAVTRRAVEAALAFLMPEFGQAMDMKQEVAIYMAQIGQ